MKGAELSEPLVKLLRKNIINDNYIQVDETTVQVLVQVLDEIGRDNKTKSYMWCYRGGGNKLSVVYEFNQTVADIMRRIF